MIQRRVIPAGIAVLALALVPRLAPAQRGPLRGLDAYVEAAFTADLEHWHYDTFRATWRDPVLGRSFLTFRLDARGRVVAVDVEGLGEFGRAPQESRTAAR